MAAPRRAAATWLTYTALRLLLFAGPFLVIWALSGNPTLSAAFAAVIGLSLSVILLGGQIAQRVERRRPSTDESVEDGRLDAAPAAAGGGQADSAAASPKP